MSPQNLQIDLQKDCQYAVSRWVGMHRKADYPHGTQVDEAADRDLNTRHTSRGGVRAIPGVRILDSTR